MENILFKIFCLLFSHGFAQVLAYPKRNTEFFIIHYLEDKRIIPVRVELNLQQQTELVIFIGGETLYDFNQRKVAYKDFDSSQCFIADIHQESFEGDRRRLQTLQNGVVRGFYVPTFIIQEELSNQTDLSETFGTHITHFCNRSTISLVSKQKNRNRRDISGGEKGQFTHHSYGHYGQQSTNYAHYGHETHITGTVDKDGQIKDQRINHQQVRSESSQVYPRPDLANGRPDSRVRSESSQVYPRPDLVNGRPDSRVRTGVPQSQYQTQYQIPPYQQNLGGAGRNLGIGTSGQFSLQSAHDGGYQLNLPLGLKAGNNYRGGILSRGHYGTGGSQPQITTDYQKYPDYIPSAGIQPVGQISGRYPLPPTQGMTFPSTISRQTGLTQEDHLRARDGSTIGATPAGYHDLDQSRTAHRFPGIPAVPQLPSIMQPHGPSSVISSITGDQHKVVPSEIPDGLRITGTQSETRTYRTGHQRQPGIDQGIPAVPQLPSIMQPHGPSSVASHITGDRHNLVPGTIPDGLHITGTQTETRTYRTGDQSPPGTDQETHTRRYTDQRKIQSGLEIKPAGPALQPSGLYPGSSISMPGTGLPGQTSHIPDQGRATQGHSMVPGHVTPGLPGTGITDTQYLTRIQRPSSGIPSIPSHLMPPQPFSMTGLTPGQQHLQTPGHISYPSYGVGTDASRSQLPLSPISGTYPDYASTTRTGPGVTQLPSQTFPGGPYSALPGSEKTTTNGIRYPYGIHPQAQTGIGRDSFQNDTTSSIPSISIDGRGIPVTRIQPGDTQFLTPGIGPIPPVSTRDQTQASLRSGERIPGSLYDSSIPSRGTITRSSIPYGQTYGSQQTGPESSRVFTQDSASSQTQIQTGFEGTAAEASAAGQYGGLGSQTQVQGGYAGNGSFSAQAQSGFIGGVVQSQVQGGKQGGLSGSSAQVERVGSAQSQVQVGQPSGSASSTAQGRFTGGTTQVQAQSGKAGGSAGAQSQSTGLSSSHVQVNIGGNDVTNNEKFQGTVSASVLGGHASGQSQTQLQGGYESGRTYVATAQGGFDSSVGYQASVPLAGSLPYITNQTIAGGQSSNAVRLLQPPGTVRDRQQSFSGSPATESRTVGSGSTDQVIDRGIQTIPSRTTDTSSTRIAEPPQYTQTPGTASQRRIISPYAPSNVQYPSSLPQEQKTPYLYPPSQITPGQLQPGYPFDSRTISPSSRIEGLVPESHDSHRYTGYDQRSISPPRISPEISKPSMIGTVGKQDDRLISPHGYLPGVQPGMQGIPTGFPHTVSQPHGVSASHQPVPGYSPSFTPGIQQPGLQVQPVTGVRHILQPGVPPPQSHILPPGFQITSPYGQPDGKMILTRPDGTTVTDSKLPIPQVPPVPAIDAPQQQWHISPPQVQIPPQQTYVPSTVQIHPQQRQISPQRVQIPPQQIYVPSSVQIHPQQQQISPPRVQIPLQQTYVPSSVQIHPHQPQISPPRVQIPPQQTYVPSSVQIHPQQPEISPPRVQIPPQQTYVPSSVQIHPQQPEISPPRVQIPPQQTYVPSSVQIHPQQPEISPPRVQIPPQQTYVPSSVQIHPQQPQISPPRPEGQPQQPHVSPTLIKTPAQRFPTPSEVTDIIQGKVPGVSEPDRKDCCKALRDLKRRCCSNGDKQDETSSCCRSGTDDIFDFSSEDDFGESKEPCKVVKAICYIVYKPVGKARVCKPTATNGC